MEGEESKPKMGRPRKNIDFEQLDKLCAIQATLEEMASWFDCTIDTIENRVKEERGVTFSEYFKQKRGVGKIALRREQYQVAMKGNVSMLIWLGKNWLGQTDKHEFDMNAEKIKEFKLAYSLKEKTENEPSSDTNTI